MTQKLHVQDGTANPPGTRHPKRPTLGARPEFYLVYLLFYFVPWFFRPPSWLDVVAAAVAIVIFLPIYFRAHSSHNPGHLGYLFALEAIAFAVSPFNGTHGVFHIYASVQAGFLRPERNAAIMIGVLALAYLLLAVVIEARLVETVFILFMGAAIGIGTMAGAEQMEQRANLERTQALERQLAAIAERERIARDLHDLLGSALTMVALKAQVADKLMDSDPQRARQEIAEIRDASRAALKDVRAAVTGMSETSIGAEIARAHTALRAAGVTFDVVGALPTLDARQSKTIGLAIREAVTNIVRHSNADTARITFRSASDELEVCIEDNGQVGDFVAGSGLTGLRQRLERIGGQAEIDMASSARITLRLPQPGPLIGGDA